MSTNNLEMSMKKCLVVALLALSASVFFAARTLASSISVTDLLKTQSVEAQQTGIVVRPKNGKITVGVWSKDKPTLSFRLTGEPDSRGEPTYLPGDLIVRRDAVESPAPVDAEGNAQKPPKAGYKYWTVNVSIPAAAQVGQDPVVLADVYDVHYFFTDVFGVVLSQVDIESTRPDPSTGEYGLENVFGVLASVRGEGASVDFPMLFGDTNGDGEVGGPGDLLYNLVDLRAYLDGAPFPPDGVLFVVGGSVGGLPGMMFSITPFTFSTATGFSGTPYTGSAYVGGNATLTAVPVPEPNTLGLWGIGAVWTVHLRRGSRRKRQPRP
jgi:hypothetical protein